MTTLRYRVLFIFSGVAVAATSIGYVVAMAGASPPDQAGTQGTLTVPAAESDRPTVEEHEAAVRATATCMRERGLHVVLQAGRGNRASTLGFEIDTLDEADDAEAIVAACREQTGLTDIEIARATDPARRDPDRIAAMLEVFKDCLARNGVAPNARDMSEADLAQLSQSLEGRELSTFAACGQLAEDDTPIGR